MCGAEAAAAAAAAATVVLLVVLFVHVFVYLCEECDCEWKGMSWSVFGSIICRATNSRLFFWLAVWKAVLQAHTH